MTTSNKTSSNYSILSNKETLNEKQKKVVDAIKIDLLDVLDMDNKLVNRNELADRIRENREKSQSGIPSGEVNLRGSSSVDIEKGRKRFLTNYDFAKTDEEKARLDTQLAEMLILDTGHVIEFKGKNQFAEERNAQIESESAFDGLNKVKKYENKIDWFSKTNKNDFFVIKWKKAELKQIIAKLKEIKEDELQKESVEKFGELERDLDTKDISYKKQMKERVEKNLQLGGELILKKGSTTVASLSKHSQDGFICNTCYDDELRELIDKDHYVLDSDDNKSYISHIRNKDLWDFIGFQEESREDPNKDNEVSDDLQENKISKNEEKEQEIERLKQQLDDNNKRIERLTEEVEKLKGTATSEVESNKESVEKIGELERDLDNKDINYKKQMKERVEKNLQIGGKLILKKGSTTVASLSKHSQDGFICNTCHDDELRKLIDKDHYVLDSNDNESYISHIRNKNLWDFIGFQEEEKVPPIIPPIDPIIPPIDPSDYNLDLNAVISDMGTNVHRERVSLETEEELRDLYKGLAWYDLPTRAYLFLSRGRKRRKMIKNKMNALSGKAFSGVSGIDEKTGDSSDRHELELSHNLSEVEKANRITIQNLAVNDLSKKFLLDQISEAQFQQDFNTIVDNDANIQSILKGEKITHIGTNILLKLKQQKARMQLIQTVNTNFNQYSSTPNQIYIDNINREIEKYIKTYQQQPEFMKDYEDFINNVPGAKNKLDNYFKHQMSVMKMQVSNVKMNMDILVKGKSAYQIDNKDRQKGWLYKLGKGLDKLPWWVQTAGFVGISVGTGILTGGLGTVAAAGITTAVTASTVGGLNFVKKWAHHTKEQNTHEKNVVTDYRNEQARIAEWQNQALNGKRYARKTYKAKRQLALYDQTTQDNIYISNTISDAVTQLSTKIGELDANEENYMKKNLIEGRARLKYYREMGHNFLASNEKEDIEKDMKRLEKSLVLGVNKIGVNLIDIEAMQARDDLGGNITYANIQKDLRNDYDKSLVQFKRERRNLATKYGIGTAVMSAGMSLGMQYLFGTGVFGGGKEGVPGSTFSDSAKENFELGKHNLLDSGTQNNIYNTGTDILNDPRVVADTEIKISFGAGTDATAVIPGNLTPADYSTKLTEVISNIKGMGLSADMEKQFIDIINAEPWKAGWSANFTNDALHGMRSAEFIEQTARAFADSGRTDLVVKFAYDSSLDIAGTNVNNMAERVVNATYNISTPDIPGTPGSNRGRFLVAPLFFNTFKDRVDEKGDKVSEKDKQKGKQSDTSGNSNQKYYKHPTHF